MQVHKEDVCATVETELNVYTAEFLCYINLLYEFYTTAKQFG